MAAAYAEGADPFVDADLLVKDLGPAATVADEHVDPATRLRADRREPAVQVVVVGAGLIGLSTAMLLADDGHEVTVLERDVDSATAPSIAFDTWERRGVNQFRLPHYFQARFRTLLDAELPRVVSGLAAAGALHINLLSLIPEAMAGPAQDDDNRFDMITGRRPLVEAVFAAVAAATPGVTVRRGSAVAGLHHEMPAPTSARHVTGVVLDSHETIRADLIIDAGGRRSPLPRWLAAIGAPAPEEELEDSGFVYYGRHFRAADGTLPAMLGPPLQHYGSISVALLPADNGTWSVTLVGSAEDTALRPLRDPDRWAPVVRSLPLAAHWIDAEPIEDGIVTMSKIEDRRRRFVVAGAPVVTGVLAVGDSWSCTNPSLGRGSSIGLLHAVALRDLLRTSAADNPGELARQWDAVTEAELRPWYDVTLHNDRHRLGEIRAILAGQDYRPADPIWEVSKALDAAAGLDPACLRATVAIGNVVELPDVAIANGVAERALEVGGDWRAAPPFGPSRQELIDLIG